MTMGHSLRQWMPLFIYALPVRDSPSMPLRPLRLIPATRLSICTELSDPCFLCQVTAAAALSLTLAAMAFEGATLSAGPLSVTRYLADAHTAAVVWYLACVPGIVGHTGARRRGVMAVTWSPGPCPG